MLLFMKTIDLYYPTLIKPTFLMYSYRKRVLVVGTAKSAHCVWLFYFLSKFNQSISAGHSHHSQIICKLCKREISQMYLDVNM